MKSSTRLADFRIVGRSGAALYSTRRIHPDSLVREMGRAITVVPYDLDAASWQARNRARLERSGKASPFVNGPIAAIAATRDLTLVTRNVRDRHLLL